MPRHFWSRLPAMPGQYFTSHCNSVYTHFLYKLKWFSYIKSSTANLPLYNTILITGAASCPDDPKVTAPLLSGTTVPSDRVFSK